MYSFSIPFKLIVVEGLNRILNMISYIKITSYFSVYKTEYRFPVVWGDICNNAYLFHDIEFSLASSHTNELSVQHNNIPVINMPLDNNVVNMDVLSR